jgi:ribosomal protein L37E
MSEEFSMAACPNCGRQTLRTKDWVCQWCGYPLISRAFKAIDKTFKELQEERGFAVKSAEAEQPEPELEREPEPEPEPPPKPRTMPLPRPVFRTEPEPERKPSPPVRPVPGLEQEMKSLREPVNNPEQKPMLVPPSAPIILPASAAPEPKLEIQIEPETAPEPPVKLESISDGMEISADQLDTLFRTDKSGAHAKFSGKTLMVRGMVEKVFVREHLEIRYIVLTGLAKKMTWSLRCTFNKEDSSKLGRLNEGDAVMVRGKYDGFSKNIMLKDCVLV